MLVFGSHDGGDDADHNDVCHGFVKIPKIVVIALAFGTDTYNRVYSPRSVTVCLMLPWSMENQFHSFNVF